MIKVDDLEGSLAEPDLPVYIDVGQPPSQDRSLADIWSALGGELKPSLDVIVTAPIMVLRSAPIGPLVLEGPKIGLATGNGHTETVAGRGGKTRSAGQADADEPLEQLQVGAKGADAGSGLSIRVRGLRAR
jgi:hypothetical protein